MITWRPTRAAKPESDRPKRELAKKGSKAKLLEAARTAGYGLVPTVHKFRVMQGDSIIGQFSNSELAHKTAREYGDSAVLDVSVTPHRVVPKGE